jgi:hypothetical protein
MEITNKNTMKNITGIFAMILVAALSLVSCQEEVPEIGTPLSADQISLEVSQPELAIDGGGKNTVVLRNLTQAVIPMWDYGTGTSVNQIDTVRYIFKGTYTIKRSAWTGGRLVQLPDATVEVTKTDESGLKHPYWTFLAGGADNEKTWVLDLDETGASQKFDGPVFFIGTDKLFNDACSGTPSCWSWFPTYQSWMPAPVDYGSMTFNLKGGPFVTVDQKVLPESGVFNGTYGIDTLKNEITFSKVTPLNWGWAQVWEKAYIYSLTEDGMQLAFPKPNSEEYEIYNYIVKP